VSYALLKRKNQFELNGRHVSRVDPEKNVPLTDSGAKKKRGAGEVPAGGGKGGGANELAQDKKSKKKV